MAGTYIRWPALGGSSSGLSVGTLDGGTASPEGGTISGSTLYFQSASLTVAGLVNTLTQSFAGAKTFDTAPTFSALTLGSVPFIGAAGLLSQDNNSLFWDNTNKRLGIGTPSPTESLHVVGGKLLISHEGTGVVEVENASVNQSFYVLKNLNGTIYLGVESNTAGATISGSVAYASLVGSHSNTALQLFTNDTVRLTIATSGAATFTGTLAASNLSGTNTGDVTIGTANGLSRSNQVLSLALSSTSTTGALSSTDWNTFNGKQASGNYITALTGDVTASGPGSVAATVAKIQGTTVSGTTGSTNVVFSSAPTLSNPVVGTQSQGDSSTKAASTAYVDTAIANAIAGVNPAVAVQAATTSASNTSGFTYSNGVSGIGATLTGPTNTALTVDGYTFTALGQRLLVKNDTQSPSGAFNGVYYVTQLQALGLGLVLTRALDYDMPSDINNTGAIPVINGTANGTTQWVLTSSVTAVGTDPLTFAEFTRNPADYLLKANNLSDVATPNTALNNILPSQTSNATKFLQTDGTNTSWANSTTPVAFRARATNGPTASANANWVFNVVDFDTASAYSNSTGNYTIPAGGDGYYHVDHSGYTTANGGGAQINVNGTPVLGLFSYSSGAVYGGSSIVQVAAGDTISLSPSTTRTFATDSTQIFFAIHKIGN